MAGAFVLIYLLLARGLFQGLRLAFLLTLLSLSAPGSLLSLGGISAEFDKEEISADEKVAFRLRMPSDCYLSHPFPSSKKYEVVSTSSGEVRKLSKMKLSSNLSGLERGPAVQEISHAYILRPLAAGTITIEPIVVQCAGRRLKTFRRELRVVASKGAENFSGPMPGDVLGRPVVIENVSRTKSYGSSRPMPEVESSREPAKESAFVGLPISQPAEVSSDSTSDYLRKQYFNGRLLVQKSGLTLKGVAVGTLAAGVIWFFLSFLRIEASRYLKARSESRNLPTIKMRSSPRAAKPVLETPEKFEGLVLQDKYEIRTQIGAGGMGMVFLADDLKLMRKVAIKKMLPELKYSREDRENFIREARLISRLTHPYIVGIHEIIEADGEIYLIFDYVDGKPLTKIIAEKKQLRLKECQDIFSHVCQAIDCAHRANICHLDLKPANIMIDKNGYSKVMDFGIAREAKDLRAKVTGGLSEAGTLFYMAPEQHMGAAGPSADVYALGVCLYEMLTGQIPFKGPDFLAQKERMSFTQPGRLVAGLPPEIELLMNAALAPDPKKRIAGALELLELLKSC